jgi:hypothetical protein
MVAARGLGCGWVRALNVRRRLSLPSGSSTAPAVATDNGVAWHWGSGTKRAAGCGGGGWRRVRWHVADGRERSQQPTDCPQNIAGRLIHG